MSKAQGVTPGLVLACGCFDILHWGHLVHLYAARAHGTRLVVALTGDAFVAKGPGRPVFDADKRKAMLLALRCVDDVIVSDAPRPDALIRLLRPAVYVKHKEYEGRLPEQALVESLGGRVVFTDTPKFSSTGLLK